MGGGLVRSLRREAVEEGDDAQRLAVLGGVAGLLQQVIDDVADPEDHPERHWFARTSDSERIDRALRETEAALARFSQRLRTSLALVSAVTSSRTLELQRRADEQAQRFQTAITALGSLVLGPALIAAVFGANVPLPLGDTWLGLALMLALMIISAALIWRVLRSLLPQRAE
jgi:Mg2+ and Co2+ transporter CorA